MTPATADYLTPPQIARRIGVKAERVIGWIRSGKLPAINLSEGSRPRFRVAAIDLQIFLAARAAVVDAPPSAPPRRPKSSGKWY